MAIRVLLASSSQSVRRALAGLIASDPGLALAGEAQDGVQAVEMVNALQPDVVLMEMTMPRIGGLEATREIMHERPTPIILLSDGAGAESGLVFQALRAGALSVLPQPGSPGAQRELLAAVRAMAGVRVIRHTLRKHATALLQARGLAPGPAAEGGQRRLDVVAIVASTGGPQTLAEILRPLPPGFAAPIVIVQHITAEFVQPLADWLRTVIQMPVEVARQEGTPQPGVVYIAPGGAHLRLDGSRHFALSAQPHDVPHTPSGDVLLESVAECCGRHALGMVLTGMGGDGAAGLLAMRRAGAHCIAQEASSCVVFGMPQEALRLGGAQQALRPPEIADLLLRMMPQEQRR